MLSNAFDKSRNSYIIFSDEGNLGLASCHILAKSNITPRITQQLWRVWVIVQLYFLLPHYSLFAAVEVRNKKGVSIRLPWRFMSLATPLLASCYTRTVACLTKLRKVMTSLWWQVFNWSEFSLPSFYITLAQFLLVFTIFMQKLVCFSINCIHWNFNFAPFMLLPGRMGTNDSRSMVTQFCWGVSWRHDIRSTGFCEWGQVQNNLHSRPKNRFQSMLLDRCLSYADNGLKMLMIISQNND